MITATMLVGSDAELLAERDGELLATIARRAEDARAAETEFYRRHVRYLYAVLKHQCRGALVRSQQEVEDLVQDTFRRAFERAATFRAEPGDLDQERRRTRAWLGRIAKNLLADALNRIKDASASLALTDAVEDAPAPIASRLLELVQQAVLALPEREQDVVRVFCLYYRVGEANQRLPNAVSAELAARWHTTPEHIRVIRGRALSKIKAHVLEHRGTEVSHERS